MRTHKLLYGLLILQFVVIIVLAIPHKDTYSEVISIFSMTEDNLSKIVIQSMQGDPIKLQRESTESGWILPDYHALPADPNKVQKLLAALNSQKHRIPIASTLESQKRFQVSSQAYKRRIELYNSENLIQNLYVGDQIGVKQAYLRSENSPYIFEYPIAHHELSTNQQDWLDKNLLQLKSIQKIEGKDYVLQKQDQGWILEGLTDEFVQDQENIDILATQLSYLRVVGVGELSNTVKPLILKVHTDTEMATYQLYHDQQSKKYLITSDKFEQPFILTEAVGESIMSWEKNKFQKPVSENLDQTVDLN